LVDAEDAIAVAWGDGGVTRPAGRNSPTTRTPENPLKGGQAKRKGGRGSDPPEGSGRTDAPTQGWGGREVDGGGVIRPPAKRTTDARLLHTRLDASTRRAHATHIRARPTQHFRIRGCRWALGGRWARPVHTSGGEWPHAGRTARAAPLRHEGMRVRVAVHQGQTAPRARDATPNGWRRNNTRRLPACPHDVGAGEHPGVATDCIHTRALALGQARARKLLRPRPTEWADRIAVPCHATAPGE